MRGHGRLIGRALGCVKRKEAPTLLNVHHRPIVGHTTQQHEILCFEGRYRLTDDTHVPTLPDQGLKDRDFLARMGIGKTQTLWTGGESLASLDDLLRKRMTGTIQV